MSDALFTLDPPALVYRRPNTVPMHKMRCRECHKSKPINGGGANQEVEYAICHDCFTDTGRTGELARRGGVRDRELVYGDTP